MTRAGSVAAAGFGVIVSTPAATVVTWKVSPSLAPPKISIVSLILKSAKPLPGSVTVPAALKSIAWLYDHRSSDDGRTMVMGFAASVVIDVFSPKLQPVQAVSICN